MARFDELMAESLAGYWLCASCGEWRCGMPVAQNTNGPVCGLCQLGFMPEAVIQVDLKNSYGSIAAAANSQK